MLDNTKLDVNLTHAMLYSTLCNALRSVRPTEVIGNPALRTTADFSNRQNVIPAYYHLLRSGIGVSIESINASKPQTTVILCFTGFVYIS
jgi:hypothetical protein